MKLDYKAIGSRIKESRNKRSLTLQDMAERIGSSAPTISAIEHGKPVGLKILVKVCDELRVSLDWVVYGLDVGYRYDPLISSYRNSSVHSAPSVHPSSKHSEIGTGGTAVGSDSDSDIHTVNKFELEAAETVETAETPDQVETAELDTAGLETVETPELETVETAGVEAGLEDSRIVGISKSEYLKMQAEFYDRMYLDLRQGNL